jgi:glucose/arabinose dehydrogenase
MLLVGLGDGGNAGDPQNRAQDLQSMLGKILRIDPRTGGPAAGNPYPENLYVWALGLRNPWRFAFDASGWLYLGDAGQTQGEELDLVPPRLQRGANYGWSVYDGEQLFKSEEPVTPGGPLISPALLYPHVEGSCAITPGPVYSGRAIPALRGSLLYGDYCAGRLMSVTRVGARLGPPRDLDLRIKGVQGFGVDTHGEALVLTVDRLARLVPGA